jgi:hypothetical protein
MSKQMKPNNRCRSNRRFNNNHNSESDLLSKEAKELIVAAAASLLLGRNNAINNMNTSGQHCNNCNVAQTIARATQQQIPVWITKPIKC